MSNTWNKSDHPRGQGQRFVDKVHSAPEAALASTGPLQETQRKLRGHNFYPKNVADWPELYETDGMPLADHPFVAHYFVGGSAWFICELDQKTGEAFGYADLGFGGGEYGYIDLPALEELHVTPHGFPQIIERDLDFTPGTKANEVIEEYQGVNA